MEQVWMREHLWKMKEDWVPEHNSPHTQNVSLPYTKLDIM